MKNIYLTILKTLIGFSVFGQTYHPIIKPNTFWDVMHHDGSQICQLTGGDRYFFLGDTTLQGNQYKIVRTFHMVDFNGNSSVFCYPYACDQSSSYICNAFMREDSIAKKVFVFDLNQNTDALLYDFNLIAGDTLNSSYAGQGLTLIVDSVRTTTLLNSAVRKIIYLNNHEYFIESIGGSQGLWFPIAQGIGFWEEPIGVIADTTLIWGSRIEILGVKETKNNISIEVFPNLVTSEFHLKVFGLICSSIYLTIYDLQGKSVKKVIINKNETTINISELQSGIYSFTLVGNNFFVTKKLVKL